MALLPLLVLAILEVALRVAGYGYATDFFRQRQVGERRVWTENDKFGLRFFPPAMARSPAPVVMAEPKPAGVCRIFLFGESAALGDPRPAYGVGRYLEALLRERYPEAAFEVVCVAMTAINSHGILPIARECARHQGDLWILYLGNNEMAGPFGANTVFGPQAPSAGWVRALLRIETTRVGQAAAALAQRWHGRGANPEAWSGLKMFLQSQLPPNDPRREAVYANFQRNLDDILEQGVRSGAKVLLSSVAVNLKDCAPFASLPAARPAAQPATVSRGLIHSADRLMLEGKPAEALQPLDWVLENEPGLAEAHFRRGHCLLGLNRAADARKSLERACDCDALPFRADSRINGILAAAAARFATRGVRFVDAPAVLGSASPTGIPGQESFYEHVHLNFAGNYRLACAFAAVVAPLLPPQLTARGQSEWATQERCEQRLGLTDWTRAAVLENVLGRVLDAPFTNQLNHLERFQALRDELAEVRARLHPSAYLEARFVYEEALRQAPQDHRLHENFAEFLEAIGDLAGATAQWEKVRDLLPWHHAGWFQVGRLLAGRRQFQPAQAALEQALAIRPDLAEAHLELGQILASQGRTQEAMARYQVARRLRPDDPKVHVRMADVLAAQNRRPEAVEHLREAVRLRASYWEARYLLGVELAMDQKLPEAQAEFEAVLRFRPGHVRAHLNLGVTLAQQLRLLEAIPHFQEVLRLDPTNASARAYLDKAQAFVAPRTPATPTPPTLDKPQ